VKIKEATKKGYAEAKVGQSINLAVPNSKTRRGRVSDIAQTLDTGMQQHTLTPDMKIRRLTPKECERLQGFPDNWTVGSDTQRYKQCGNAVTVNVIRDIAERLLTPPTKS
jgi:DNA (cytosine-5)-methyltransferase 1